MSEDAPAADSRGGIRSALDERDVGGAAGRQDIFSAALAAAGAVAASVNGVGVFYRASSTHCLAEATIGRLREDLDGLNTETAETAQTEADTACAGAPQGRDQDLEQASAARDRDLGAEGERTGRWQAWPQPQPQPAPPAQTARDRAVAAAANQRHCDETAVLPGEPNRPSSTPATSDLGRQDP